MKTLDKKLIVYDSNCKLCSSLRGLVLRFTRIPASKIVAFKDLSPEKAALVDGSRFRNAMALIDVSGDQTLYGEEGIAYIFSSEYRIADVLLRIKPLFKLFTFFYKTQAYNRYVIATPKSAFACDCLPDRILKYRVSYIAMCAVIAVALTALFGISLATFFIGLRASEAARQMLLMAGTGWILQIVLASMILREKALDYVGHLATIMVAGLLVLTPWMLFHFLTGLREPLLPAVSVFVSSLMMLRMHVCRTRYLQLSQIWTFTWFILLQTTAFFWIYIFHLKS